MLLMREQSLVYYLVRSCDLVTGVDCNADVLHGTITMMTTATTVTLDLCLSTVACTLTGSDP